MHMTSEEYLRQLGNRLYSLPADRRKAVLAYYRDYFDRAGAENVDMVFRELGTSERLSQKIYEDYNRETVAYRDIMSHEEKISVHENTVQQPQREPYIE